MARINELLRGRFGDLDITITTGAGDAERAGFRAATDGESQLFVAGGDGTLNEVMNGVYATGRLGDVVFGLLPLGTGNDFAAAIGIEPDVDDAVRAFGDGHVIPVDVGRLDDRVFVNVSAGGFVAEVSEAVTPELKTMAGRLAYLIGGAQALLSYEPVRARIEPIGASHLLYPSDALDAVRHASLAGIGTHEVDLQLFAVCNSRLIGGGRLIAPEAVIDDGLAGRLRNRGDADAGVRGIAAGSRAGRPPRRSPRQLFPGARFVSAVRSRHQGQYRRPGTRCDLVPLYDSSTRREISGAAAAGVIRRLTVNG